MTDKARGDDRVDPAHPLVTVVTPAFNAARYIRENIESVLGQDYRSIEHIIYDGCSTDGTVDILREYKHLKWLSEPDRGQSDALNKGFKLARGEIIGWLNADDTYAAGAVSRAVCFLVEHPDVDLVYGDVRVIDQESRELGISRSEAFDLERLLLLNPIQQPSVFLRRRCIEALGGVDECLQYVMDWELWLRAALAGFKTAYLRGEVLASFRLCVGTKSYEHPADFRREWLSVLDRLFASEESGRIPDSAKRISLKKHRAQLQLDNMLRAIARRDRRMMFRFLTSAIAEDPGLVKNRGLWLFLGMGLLGRNIDPLRKYQKRSGPR